MGKYFCKKRKRKIIQCEFFTKNYKQKTDNYFTNSYAGINEGEGWGEGEEIRWVNPSSKKGGNEKKLILISRGRIQETD